MSVGAELEVDDVAEVGVCQERQVDAIVVLRPGIETVDRAAGVGDTGVGPGDRHVAHRGGERREEGRAESVEVQDPAVLVDRQGQVRARMHGLVAAWQGPAAHQDQGAAIGAHIRVLVADGDLDHAAVERGEDVRHARVHQQGEVCGQCDRGGDPGPAPSRGRDPIGGEAAGGDDRQAGQRLEQPQQHQIVGRQGAGPRIEALGLGAGQHQHHAAEQPLEHQQHRPEPRATDAGDHRPQTERAEGAGHDEADAKHGLLDGLVDAAAGADRRREDQCENEGDAPIDRVA